MVILDRAPSKETNATAWRADHYQGGGWQPNTSFSAAAADVMMCVSEKVPLLRPSACRAIA
jgi:hypothetical protein